MSERTQKIVVVGDIIRMPHNYVACRYCGEKFEQRIPQTCCCDRGLDYCPHCGCPTQPPPAPVRN